MTNQSSDLLTRIEQTVNRKFMFRTKIQSLLEISQSKNMDGVFEDVLFLSKFLTHAYAILKREGANSETTIQLQTEFKTNLEKLHTLLRTIVKDADDTMKQDFVSSFLGMKAGNLENLLKLAHELTWIKNYQLDQAK